jgi:hypothetical protein
MVCPTCGAALAPVTECVRCAARERGAGSAQGGAVIVATPERGRVRVAPAAPAGALIPASIDARPLPIGARVGLPVRLWRQPAVRAVARAGAGALALSVGLRLARVWLARSIARRGAPPLAHALTELPTATRPERPVARGEVVETWIYVRQERLGR